MSIYISIIAENAMTILTALTVLILFYYTKETYLLRKESQKQTQIQFTPSLALRNLKEGAAFANLGKGIARSVQVSSDVQIQSRPILLIPSIGAGEDRKLYYMGEKGDAAWIAQARELPDKVQVSYLDALGHEYRASFTREYSGMGVFREVTQERIK